MVVPSPTREARRRFIPLGRRFAQMLLKHQDKKLDLRMKLDRMKLIIK